MKRWFWFVLAILISTFVYSTIRYGLRPKPIPILNPTEFEDPQQIGAVIYKRLRQNIRPERLIVLGSNPDVNGYDAIWSGFLKTAKADQVKVDVLLQSEGLRTPQSAEGIEVLPFDLTSVGSGDFIKQVNEHLRAGHLVVVHGLTQEVSHLMKDSLTRRLEEAVHHPVLALSTVTAALSPEDFEAKQRDCVSPSLDHEGDLRLHCATARIAKILQKKHPTTAHIWAVMERHGLQEYLIFVYP